MEMVFRKIEYWIEGNANKQRRLNSEEWSGKKLIKKTCKHLIFLSISILIAHVAMAYLIGVDQTLLIIQDSPAKHTSGFVGLVGFTAVFYSVFAYFREQACVAICPYGRLQGVLLGKDSIVVAYDWLRGEPRRRVKTNQLPEVKTGDCIDCKLCVHACPTGIDIRHGTQLECINCTACIDACDDVMVKVHRPKGLIRYASYSSIQNGKQKLFTLRVGGYTAVLVTLLALLGFTLYTRSDVETTVLKVSGTLYQRTEDGFITNLYNVEFVNKTFSELPLELKVESPPEATLIKPDGSAILIPAEGFLKTIYFIRIPAMAITQARTVVTLGVYRNSERLEQVNVKFIGPVKMKSKP